MAENSIPRIPDSAASLVARCRAGDRAAESLLAARAARQALRTASVALADHQSARDVSQDVAVRALRGLRRLRDPAQFDAYRSHGTYCLAIDSGVGICDSAGGWRRELGANIVVPYGPTPDGTGYGVTRADVARVRMTFSNHPAIIADARHGGFAIRTKNTWQNPSLELLDAHGHLIARTSVY